MVRRLFLRGLSIGLGWLAAASVFALSVTVDPGSYLGDYSVSGSVPGSGVRVFELAGGNHIVDAGSSIGLSQFSLTVDEGAGTVTSNNSIAANASGASLTFNTVEVVLDPSDLSTPFIFTPFGTATLLTGAQTIDLLPSLGYLIDNGNTIGQSAFSFTVAADGNVTSLNSTAASGVGNQLEFATVPVTVDPGGYAGLYRVGQSSFDSGVRDFRLIRGLRYQAGSGVFAIDFTPQSGGVDPAVEVVEIDGQEYTFRLIPEPGVMTQVVVLQVIFLGCARRRRTKLERSGSKSVWAASSNRSPSPCERVPSSRHSIRVDW